MTELMNNCSGTVRKSRCPQRIGVLLSLKLEQKEWRNLVLTCSQNSGPCVAADGINVRFMNSDLAGNNLRTADEIKAFVAQVSLSILLAFTPAGVKKNADSSSNVFHDNQRSKGLLCNFSPSCCSC